MKSLLLMVFAAGLTAVCASAGTGTLVVGSPPD